MAKINISINNALLEEMEALAKQNYTSRSGIISMACANYVQQHRLTDSFVNSAKALQRIAETGVMSDADKQELETFVKIAQLYHSTL